MVAFLLFLLLPLARIDVHYFFGDRQILAHGAALLFLSLFFINNRKEMKFLPVTFFDLMVGSFYLLYALSLVNAESTEGGILPALLEASFLTIYVFFRILSGRLQERGEVKAFLFIVLTGTSLLAIWGLLQYFFGFDVSPGLRQLFASHHFPIIASMGNPNFLSEYLLLALPLSLAAGMLMKRFYIFGILFFLQGLCIYLTYSRLAWAVLLLFMGLSFLFFREKRKYLASIYLLFVVAALSIFAVHNSSGRSQTDRVIKNITRESPFAERSLMYHAAFSMAGDSSFSGQGPGAFARSYPLYRSAVEREQRVSSPEKDVVELKHAHSDFLEIAFDNGYGAAFVYFIMMISAVAAGIRFALHNRGDAVCAIGLVPMLMVPFSLWSFPFFLPFSKMIFLFSVAFLGREKFRLPLKLPLKMLTALLLLTGLTLFSFQVRYFHSLFYYNKGIDLFETNMEKSRRALEKSIELFPYEGFAWFSLGSLLLNGGYREGIDHLEHSLLFYADGEVYLNLARGCRDFDDIETSLKYYRRFLELLPLEEGIRREMMELQSYHDSQKK